jgi:hypothetical protein
MQPKLRKSELIAFRLTKAERSQLEKDARDAGLSLRDYLLKCWKEKRG